MAYTRERALEFWYEFDQKFLFAASPEVVQLYQVIYGPNFALDQLVDMVRDHPEDLALQIGNRAQGILRLAEIQRSIMDHHFPDRDELRQAFEDFGQGILFDDKPSLSNPNERRRPTSRLIHMMDGTPDDCIGYHRWHAFIRAAIAAGAEADYWLYINRLVALAWGIYSELDPKEDSLSNPAIDARRLSSLRNGWLQADSATLNAGFLNYSGRFPDDYGSRRAKHLDEIGYHIVQKLLTAATQGSNPQHAGVGKFWLLKFEQFVKVRVYGHLLISPAGANRGATSALVKSLRGTLPGFPRMPLHRPPLNDVDIRYIERWIDNLEV